MASCVVLCRRLERAGDWLSVPDGFSVILRSIRPIHRSPGRRFRGDLPGGCVISVVAAFNLSPGDSGVLLSSSPVDSGWGLFTGRSRIVVGVILVLALLMTMKLHSITRMNGPDASTLVGAMKTKLRQARAIWLAADVDLVLLVCVSLTALRRSESGGGHLMIDPQSNRLVIGPHCAYERSP